MMKKIIVILAFILFTIPGAVDAQEVIRDEPVPVITNITPVSFTVSWFSRDKEEQYITYGKAAPTEKSAVDDSGPGTEGVTHHVTIRALEPDTEYLFKINIGERVYRQKTAALIPNVLPPLAERFKGTVMTEDNTVPEESIIYMKILGAQLLSTRVSNTGEWQIRTFNTRMQDLSRYYKLRETDYVDFFVRAGYEGENAKRIYAYARENPVDINLVAPRIPFYKIKFPGLEVYEAVPVGSASPAPASSPDPSIQTAGDEGFFQTIWKRVKEIF